MKILALPPLAALLVASCGAVPASVPSYAAVVSDLWRDLGGGESHGPVCGLMTTTPLGAAHLVEGVIFPPRPSSPLRWWWSFALFGSSCFCAFLRSVASTSLGLRRSSSGGCFAAVALADALSPSSYWLKITSGGCFAAVVSWLGGCFATVVVL